MIDKRMHVPFISERDPYEVLIKNTSDMDSQTIVLSQKHRFNFSTQFRIIDHATFENYKILGDSMDQYNPVTLGSIREKIK